jgi:hypothetical protein
MNLNNIQPASGATHNSKRIGRGQGSGKGGTSTKGHKGQKLELVILKKSVLKVVKCLCKEDYQNSDLITSVEKSIEGLTLILSKH